MNNERIFINSAKAAEFLGVSGRTIQRLRDNGKIRYYKDARIIRYKISDLVEYLENHVYENFN